MAINECKKTVVSKPLLSVTIGLLRIHTCRPIQERERHRRSRKREKEKERWSAISWWPWCKLSGQRGWQRARYPGTPTNRLYRRNRSSSTRKRKKRCRSSPACRTTLRSSASPGFDPRACSSPSAGPGAASSTPLPSLPSSPSTPSSRPPPPRQSRSKPLTPSPPRGAPSLPTPTSAGSSSPTRTSFHALSPSNPSPSLTSSSSSPAPPIASFPLSSSRSYSAPTRVSGVSRRRCKPRAGGARPARPPGASMWPAVWAAGSAAMSRGRSSGGTQMEEPSGSRWRDWRTGGSVGRRWRRWRAGGSFAWWMWGGAPRRTARFTTLREIAGRGCPMVCWRGGWGRPPEKTAGAGLFTWPTRRRGFWELMTGGWIGGGRWWSRSFWRMRYMWPLEEGESAWRVPVGRSSSSSMFVPGRRGYGLFGLRRGGRWWVFMFFRGLVDSCEELNLGSHSSPSSYSSSCFFLFFPLSRGFGEVRIHRQWKSRGFIHFSLNSMIRRHASLMKSQTSSPGNLCFFQKYSVRNDEITRNHDVGEKQWFYHHPCELSSCASGFALQKSHPFCSWL